MLITGLATGLRARDARQAVTIIGIVTALTLAVQTPLVTRGRPGGSIELSPLPSSSH